MQIKVSLTLILTFVCSAAFSQINFGKLKEKASEYVKEKVADKTAEKRDEYDTSSFNYAIAFLDKSESYENKEQGQGLIKAANFLMQESEEKDDQEKARDLYEFGRINYMRRNYKLAEAYLLAAMAAYEVLDATDGPVYLKTLGTLGLLHSDMGRFDGAEDFTIKAKDGWSKTLGAKSAGFAAESNNQAVLQFQKGEYVQAEKSMIKAIELIKTAEGSSSVPYAISLNNLGIIYQYMGRAAEALDQLNKCLAIADKKLREHSGTYVQLMTNKALVLQENRQFEEAEKVYNEALELQTSRLKLNRKSDPDYAHMLNNLASLYVITDRAGKAEDLLQESLAIYMEKFGALHPLTATAQADLGNLYRFSGRYTEASTLLIKALATRKKTLGDQHPKTIQSLEDLAVVRWKQGKTEEARQYFTTVMDESLAFINEFFAPMSEVEKTKYWEKLKPRFYIYYNFAFENKDKFPELIESAINYRLATKGLLLNATTKIKKTILNSGDSKLIAHYNQWQDQKRTLAAYYALSKEEISEQKINLDSLERETNESERKLSEQSSAFAEAFVSKSKSYKEVKGVLKNNEAVVEIIQFPYYNTSLTDEIRYAVAIFQKDKPIDVVIMENGNDLDKRYFSLYKNLIKRKLDDDHSYKNFWAPMEAKLPGISTLYFSPDGVFNQININTLKKPNGTYLVENLEVHVIGNPLDIVGRSGEGKSSLQAFLLGFPSYGNSDIAPLPGTKKEIEKVGSALKANRFQLTTLLQNEATETAIKKVTNPRLMHIATHGFFLEDVLATGNVFGVQVEYARNNPLLRSGLILAGGGQTAGKSRGQSFDQDNNGILTAYEAMGLALDGTDLVVLSACETAVGDVKSGEGVYGLQRAFMVAGADKMIMSLWKVDDQGTQQLMSGFYDLWMNKRLPVQQAFRQAQLNLMKTYREPYYWGAFVMVE